MTCFLTSGLHYLVVGDYLVTKHSRDAQCLAGMRMWLSPCSVLRLTHAYDSASVRHTTCRLARNYDDTLGRTISLRAWKVIEAADEQRNLAAVLRQMDLPENDPLLLDELFDLWGDRWVLVRP